MVAVDCQTFAAVVGCVYDFEDIAADQFVVAVDGDQNLSFSAVSMYIGIEIGHMVLPFVIFDQNNLLSELLTIFQLLLQILNCVVVRGIIDDDYAVVCVVLLGDGVQIEKISKSFVVFVARDNYTHLEFIIAAYAVF